MPGHRHRRKHIEKENGGLGERGHFIKLIDLWSWLFSMGYEMRHIHFLPLMVYDKIHISVGVCFLCPSFGMPVSCIFSCNKINIPHTLILSNWFIRLISKNHFLHSTSLHNIYLQFTLHCFILNRNIDGYMSSSWYCWKEILLNTNRIAHISSSN